MSNYYNNYRRNHNTMRRPAHRDCSMSVMAAIDRAYREISSFYSDDVTKMMNFVNTHHFHQSPAPALHGIINAYHKISGFYSDDAKRQMWNVLHKYSR